MMQKLATGTYKPRLLTFTKTKNNRGFTLIEVLIVLAIIAIGTGIAAMAFPPSDKSSLEKEATRLIAILESARTIARSSSLAVVWHATEHGFIIDGIPNAKLIGANGNEAKWLHNQVTTQTNSQLILGPEPIITKQQLTLNLNNSSIKISTDGIKPFSISINEDNSNN